MIRTFNLHSVAALALATALLAAPAAAQDAPIPVAEEDRGDGPITTSQDIVVLGSVGYRNRTEEAEPRSEEHTSELQSLMRISYAVFCLKKKKKIQTHNK